METGTLQLTGGPRQRQHVNEPATAADPLGFQQHGSNGWGWAARGKTEDGPGEKEIGCGPRRGQREVG